MGGKKGKLKHRMRPVLHQNPPKIPPAPEPAPSGAGQRRWRAVMAAAIGLLTVAVLVWIRVRHLSSPDGRIQKSAGMNVLLITLDTTRADRLGCYGYSPARTPNIDSLAAAGVRFVHAYSQVPLTTPSHSSILTATYPYVHGVHNNGGYYLESRHATLAKILKERGYRTAAFVSSFSVDSRFGLNQGFDVYDDHLAQDAPFKSLNSERKAGDTYAVFARWFERNFSAKFFCWIHFYDPHLPYSPPSPYREQFADQPYDGELAYVDEYVGRIIEKLRSAHLLDRTLIVVAGDHGEGFGEHGERGHGIFLYDETLHVPLILNAPGHLPRKQVIDARVRLIDIMPTVLDLLLQPAPGPVQGISLLPYISGGARKDLDSYIETYFPRENFGWAELTGLVSDRWKYIRAPKSELYELDEDPAELRNSVSRYGEIARKLKKGLEAMVLGGGTPHAVLPSAMSAEEKNRLASLGYISFLEKNGIPEGQLPDPKDKLDELQLIQNAQFAENGENFVEAEKLYERLLALRPNAPASYINLALVMARRNELPQAVRTLEQGINRIPDSESLLTRLGHTLMVTGDTARALSVMRRVLVVNDRSFDAHLVTALILSDQKDGPGADTHFRRALEIDPGNRFAGGKYASFLVSGGNLNQAASVYERLLAIYPDDPGINQNAGIVYGMLGNLERSIVCLEYAARLRPTPMALLNLAVAYRDKGNRNRAIACFKQYLENSSGESESNIQRVRQELAILENGDR